MVNNNCCCCRGPEFGSQLPHAVSQLSPTLVPGALKPTLTSVDASHVHDADLRMQTKHAIHIKQINLKISRID